MTIDGLSAGIFARSLGFCAKAPGFGHPSTPRYLRIILSLALTIAIRPTLPMQTHGLPRAAQNEALTVILAVVGEFLIGAALGLCVAILFDAAYAGGRCVDDYLGVKSAMPMATVASGAEFGRLWSNAFLAGFIFSGGLERLVLVFSKSVAVFPIGCAPSSTQIFQYAVHLAAMLAQMGVFIAFPAVLCACSVQVVLGLIGKFVPRLTVFSLSFPIVYACALGISMAALPNFMQLSTHPWLAQPFFDGAL